MAGWVYLDHPDTAGGPERYPDDPEVIRVAEAKGWVLIDDPNQPAAATSVEPDEVDDRGQGWVYLDHPDLPGGPERFPVEVVGDMRARGWETPAALEAKAAAAAAKKTSKKTASKPVGDDTSEEK